MSKIIAIAGLKNSGKTEAAKMMEYLLNTPSFLHNYFCFKHLPKIYNRWKLVAFAGTLKQMLADMLNIDVTNFDDRNFKENTFINLQTLQIGDDSNKLTDCVFTAMLKNKETLENQTLSIRQLMQYFGTEICHKYFGRKVWINTTLNTNTNLIVGDLRFKAEAEAVKKRNGKLIYISRQGTEVGNHASEKEVITLLNNKEFDFVIYNNTTLKDLFYKLKKYVKII